MMSKERELLKRTLKFIVPDEDNESLDYDLLLYSQIRDLLTQPEPEPYCWEVSNLLGNKQYLYSKPRDEVYSKYNVIPLYRSPQKREPVTNEPTTTAMAVMPNGVCVSNVYDAYEEGRKSVMVEQEPDIDYIVREIHKKCFHQSLNTAPVITVRDALSIFRKFLKSKRTLVVKPKFD